MIRYIPLFILVLDSTIGISQQWNEVDGGTDGWVNVMRVDTINDLLFVGGDYYHAGGNPSNSIAIWNGSNWSSLGNNDAFSGAGSVSDIAFFNGDVIAAGLFDSIGQIAVNNIAKFDGVQWQALGNGFSGHVFALEIFNNELYAAGDFLYSGVDTFPHIAKWNGNNWEKVGDDLYGGYIHTLKVVGNKLYAGGQSFFTQSQSFPYVASWDGVSWDTVGYGFNDVVIQLRIFQNELYAVGDFTPWTFNPSTRISKWDGSSWQSMPFPTGGNQQQITDLVEYHNALYICGFFNQPPDFIRFNGSGYDSLCDVSGFINNLCVYKNELYVGGLFNSINGITVSNIAKFNDASGIFENKIPSSDEFMKFSNPRFVDQEFEISFDEKIDLNKSVLQIIDSSGKEYYSTTGLNQNYFNVKLSYPGLYYIVINFDDKVISKKLIIVPQ